MSTIKHPKMDTNLRAILAATAGGPLFLSNNAGILHGLIDDDSVIHVWYTGIEDTLWIEGFDFAQINGAYSVVAYRSDTPIRYQIGGYVAKNNGKIIPKKDDRLKAMADDVHHWLDSMLNAISCPIKRAR